MDIEQLRTKYLRLVNEELPAQAKQREFPVSLNHCFARIILDNLFNCCWYEVIDRKQGAAYKQLSSEQLEKAIEIAEDIIDKPDSYVRQLNQNSLRWRNKL
ncbi:hypothetical protein [Myxosarcina sp. GI1]|uniref:hypothetical protein n=1 Tax=Myxosarcina sp. GI1 TaxID=1541065 RepID=UPI00055DA0D8|nr:hypothetical protein [Myxosarcina sp. GI1]